jgi:hypothetical protein
MTILRPLWDFWSKPIRAESLALFRITLALTVLCSQMTGIMRTLPETCGPDGLCPIETNDEWIGYQGRISLLRGPATRDYLLKDKDALPPNAREKKNGSAMPLLGTWLPDWLVEDHPWLDHLQNWVSVESAEAWDKWGARWDSHVLLFIVFLLSLVCLALGLGTRFSALVAVLLAATFHHRLPSLMNGGDSLFRNGLYFLLLAPAGATWSLDRVIGRKIRRWLGWPVSDEPVMIAPWSVRLMQIQVCCMYLFTGLVKTSDAWLFSDTDSWGDYIDGQALYWVFNDVAITRVPYARVPIPMFVCRMMTWTTLAFELWFSLIVCFRRWTRLLVTVAVLSGLALAILGVAEALDWASPPMTDLVLFGQALLVGMALLAGLCVMLLVIALLVLLARLWLRPSRERFDLKFPFVELVSPRFCVLLIGLSLHVGIFLVMEIGWFSQVALCWYALFIPGEKLSGFVERVGVWLRGQPAEPAPVRLAA